MALRIELGVAEFSPDARIAFLVEFGVRFGLDERHCGQVLEHLLWRPKQRNLSRGDSLERLVGLDPALES
jgi:hypothetical protein